MQSDEFRSWLSRTGKSTNTIRMYVHKIDEWQSSELTPTEWIEDAREMGASAASVKMMLAAIRSYSKFTGESFPEIIDYKAPPVPAPRAHPLAGGIADARRALAVATHTPHAAAIALGSFAGLRVSESIALTRGDIQNGELVVKGKGSKVRRVPISTELEVHLNRIETWDLVPICNASARRGITKVFNRIGAVNVLGKPVSSHDLRATFATEVYTKSKDIKLVQELLGHESVETTQVYIGVSTDALRKAVEL